jgi:hypothetical protein
MTTFTATPIAPSAAGSNHDTRGPDLQVKSLTRLFSIALPLAICLAPLIYGDKR